MSLIRKELYALMHTIQRDDAFRRDEKRVSDLCLVSERRNSVKCSILESLYDFSRSSTDTGRIAVGNSGGRFRRRVIVFSSIESALGCFLSSSYLQIACNSFCEFARAEFSGSFHLPCQIIGYLPLFYCPLNGHLNVLRGFIPSYVFEHHGSR